MHKTDKTKSHPIETRQSTKYKKKNPKHGNRETIAGFVDLVNIRYLNFDNVRSVIFT